MSFFIKISPIVILILSIIFITGIKAQELNSSTENNSKFINQFFPSEMDTGKKYIVWLSYKNTGNSVWSSKSSMKTEQFKIALFNNVSNNVSNDVSNDVSNEIKKPFGDFSNILLRKDIKPGETAIIEFEINASSKSGNYDSQWSMMKGNEYFGDVSEMIIVNVSENSLISKNVAKTVTTETTLAEDADKSNTPLKSSAFEKQIISKLMKCTYRSAVSVTMKNNGNTRWTSDSYFLMLVNDKMQPVNSNPWGIGNIKLPADVEAGSSVTLKFQVIAPLQPGTYTLQFGMTEKGEGFGNPTDLVEVTVMK